MVCLGGDLAPFERPRECGATQGEDTRYTELAAWFRNGRTGISAAALGRRAFYLNTPMIGIVESLDLGTSSGIVLYEIARQRREYQERLTAKIAAKKATQATS